MMVLSWCCCRRVVVTLAVWMTTIAAVAAATGGGGGGHPAATAGSSQPGAAPSLIHQLERSLLSMFGMQQRPRVKRAAAVPPYMMELYHRQAGFLYPPSQQTDSAPLPNYIGTRGANTVRSFIHRESPADDRYPGHRMRFHFNVTNIPPDELLHSADLRLIHTIHPSAPALNVSHVVEKKVRPSRPHRRKKWSSTDVPYLQRIMIYDILRRATKTSEPALRLLDTKVIDARKGGTQTLDVYDALSRWITEPKKNFGLLVDVVPLKQTNVLDTSHVHLRRPSADDQWHEKQPLLVTHTNDSKAKSRSKRSATVKHKKTKNYCKRHPLYVDFRKVGWDDWIVAPAGYEAFFCKGDCPFPLSEEMNATNHAVVQTLVNSRYPDRVPKACCVPTELSAISMLYMDDDERFVLKNHQDMVVEGCGCR